jgi:hypothetical protein
MRESQNKQSDRPPDESDIDQTIVDLDPEDETSENLRRRLLLRRFWESAAASGGARADTPRGF